MDASLLDAAVEALATEFSARFPTHLSTDVRIIGREAEYPIVSATGEAADVRRLWPALLADGDLQPEYDRGNPNFIVGARGDDYSYALEVGVGTIEVNTRPCIDLFTLQDIHERAVDRLARAAARLGYGVLGYGIQPVTPPSLPLMSPKQRYQSLYRAMGAAWLWYTVTASDQIQIDITRDEMVFMLNFGNLITPVIIALCANSSVYDNQISPFCSGREGEMARILTLEHRHGMLARPVTDMADFVRTMAEPTHLILKEEGDVIPSSRPFTDYLLEQGADFDAFLFHEHYIWNSARLRAAYGTLEIRPACQQPWSEHMAAMALSLGLLEAAPEISRYIQDELGETYWEVMQDYHQATIMHGLAAPQPTADFLPHVVELSRRGLRDRGYGEETLLAPIDDRLERHHNPAQRSRQIFAIDGIQGLLRHAWIRPGR